MEKSNKHERLRVNLGPAENQRNESKGRAEENLNSSSENALERIRQLRRPLPSGYRFERLDANRQD